MPYCMICHKEDCDCTHDILERIDASVITNQVAAFNIRLLRRDKFELVQALKDLIETCPADPDSTDAFLDANHKAVELIDRLTQKTTK